MPTQARRIRDRVYQRKRRLLHQVRAGKITPTEMETILTAYAANQIEAPQEKNDHPRQD